MSDSVSIVWKFEISLVRVYDSDERYLVGLTHTQKYSVGQMGFVPNQTCLRCRVLEIEEAVSRAEEIIRRGYSIKENWKELEKLMIVFMSPGQHPQSKPTQEQYMRVYQMAIDLYKQGFAEPYPNLPNDAFFPGVMLKAGFNPRGIFDNKYSRHIGSENRALLISSHMIASFVENVANEPVEFLEILYQAEFGERFNRLRLGFLAVTPSRLFIVGVNRLPGKDRERYYLLYPDLEDKTYYGSLDYIYLDKIKNVRLKYGIFKQEVVIHLQDIDYAKVRTRRIIGPLFYRSGIGEKEKRRTGSFKLYICFLKIPEQSKAKHKERYMQFVHKLQNRY